jgi:hypothetical protein
MITEQPGGANSALVCFAPGEKQKCGWFLVYVPNPVKLGLNKDENAFHGTEERLLQNFLMLTRDVCGAVCTSSNQNYLRPWKLLFEKPVAGVRAGAGLAPDGQPVVYFNLCSGGETPEGGRIRRDIALRCWRCLPCGIVLRMICCWCR